MSAYTENKIQTMSNGSGDAIYRSGWSKGRKIAVKSIREGTISIREENGQECEAMPV